MACTRDQMTDFFDALLHPDDFSDYCPNGLQVEGKSQIKHFVSGVTASQALVDAAIAEGFAIQFVTTLLALNLAATCK